MNIAIPRDGGIYLCQHFGRTLGFAIFEVANDLIIKQEYRVSEMFLANELRSDKEACSHHN